MPLMISLIFNDLSENLIQCVFYEILGCVLRLVENCAVNTRIVGFTEFLTLVILANICIL